MDEKLMSLLSGVTDERLFGWTDPKMVGRAHGYLDKVEGIVHIDGQGIVARVHGTSDYYTRVFVGDDGGVESECSCPVGHRCKHAVALILNVAKMLKDGELVSEGSTESGLWKAAERAFAEVNAKLDEREREKRERRLAKEREEEEFRKRMKDWRDEELAKFGAFLQGIRDCNAQDDCDGVLRVLDEACGYTNDDFDREPFDGEVYDIIQEMSLVAVEAIERSRMSSVEKIILAHYSETPYRYYEPPKPLYDAYWKEENAEKFDDDAWSAVGDEIRRRLAAMPEDELSYHETSFDVFGAMTAFARAGRLNDRAEICAKYADTTCNWASAADLMMELGRFEDAKAVLRRGMNGTYMGNGSIENFAPMCDKYADALSAEGNHSLAATVRAGAFLFRRGMHCGERTVELFNAVLDEAGKANAREAVRMALLRILRTGAVPRELAVREVDDRWSWVKPGVNLDDVPPWPLPPLPTQWELRLSRALWSSKREFIADQKLVDEIEKGEALLHNRSPTKESAPSEPLCS